MPTSQPDCVLFNVHAYLGQRRNATTASATTRSHDKIEVSLFPARPPLPSELYVHCPVLRLTVLPRVIRTTEDLLLLRVAVDCPPNLDDSSPRESDYRHPKGALAPAALAPAPLLLRRDEDVGLLSRGANYTVAALMADTGTPPAYDLHIFHSENPCEWIRRKVSVMEPMRRFPLLIPDNCSRLLHHETTTVVSIGGEGGTMGWADLWDGVLLCDVLRDEPTLRAVPVPVPLDLVSCDNGRGAQLDCPIPFRGIAFVKDNPNGDGCLKLVHKEANATLVPGNEYDDETGSPNFQMHDWTILTYTNTAMTTSWKDWRRDSRLQASDITIDAQIKSELLQSGSGLLGSAPGEALHNLLVSHPALDISAEAAHQGVVYLMARKKYKQPTAWVLALDTRNKTLLGAAEFGTERQPSAHMSCIAPAALPSI
ncbi:unnamed protein product [Urochloa decumbens]|uniref:DUF1618 domain-containing protein n=1 Tax=Urochloa decumbens TaxID=240449 RepID=A0ABC9E378_9POAL